MSTIRLHREADATLIGTNVGSLGNRGPLLAGKPQSHTGPHNEAGSPFGKMTEAVTLATPRLPNLDPPDQRPTRYAEYIMRKPFGRK